MAKETQWFGRGSWIIITTQDKRILNQHRINHIYEVGFPHDDEALQIFCMNAFGQSSPYEGFEDLAWEATILCGNLPLGLRVMGSHFKGMEKHEWEKELPWLRNNLDGEIESILKLSYDALFEEDKRLFLFIACFFYYEEVEKVEAYLATNFSDVKRGLHVLAEKSLISIEYDYTEMHDLLRHLGREIVRKQSIQKLEKRQFLLDAKDICQVLSNDIVANRSLIGIDFYLSETEDELYQSDIVFDRMYALEFLRIHDNFEESISYFPQKTYHLPRKLKLLQWDYCPMKTLPSNFNPEFLVELDMFFSKLEKLWEGSKMIRNLKWINLSYSKDLKELTELSTATNLKELDLSYCSSLVELPSSIGDAINLEILILNGCTSLVELPSSIGNAINLKELNLVGCTKLVSLPELPGSLAIINAENCESLERLNCSFHISDEFNSSLYFGKCFKLNQEARDLIMTSTFGKVVLPGDKVPRNFTYRATGNSLSVTLDGIDLPKSVIFKVCFLLVNEVDCDVEVDNDMKISYITPYCRHFKRNDINVLSIATISSGHIWNKHLYIFHVPATITSSKLVFKFEIYAENWEIEECGLSIPTLQVDRS